MSTKFILTKTFRVHAAKQLLESFTESANSIYYSFAAKHTEYPGSDSNVVQPTDSVYDTCSGVYSDMIFGKKIDPADINLMIPRYNWVSGTVYAQYDDTDGDLYDKNFYIMVDTGTRKHVFKCLFNNNGVASTVQPDPNATSPSDEFYETADGYQWKFMYSIPVADFRKFATDDYIPVIANNDVASNAINGAIDVILVTSNGSNYDTSLSGEFVSNTEINYGGDDTKLLLGNSASSNTDFYINSSMYLTTGTGAGQIRKITDYSVANNVKIVTLESAFTVSPDIGTEYEITPSINVQGDGSNLVARALVNTAASNSIYKVEILDRGTNYSYASLSITGNTGGVSNAATLRAVLPPKGGHGADVEEELGASTLGLEIKFSNTESGSIPVSNDIRTVGILRDPSWANVSLNITAADGNFIANDTIYNFEPEHFFGTVSTTAGSNTVLGIDTNFGVGIGANDYIFISNNTTTTIRQIVSVTNSSSIEVDSPINFGMTSGNYYKAYIKAQGTTTSTNGTVLVCNNFTGQPNTSYQVAGYKSDAVASISSIEINGRTVPSYVFNTFDQRFRYNIITQSGTFEEGEQVFVSNINTQNAYIQQVNTSYIATTNKFGDFDIGDVLTGSNTSATANIISFVVPDLEPMSGKVLYIENTEAFARADNRSETFKVIMKF
jgi:hypothetical protein